MIFQEDVKVFCILDIKRIRAKTKEEYLRKLIQIFVHT